jgi:hypothetical protein
MLYLPRFRMSKRTRKIASEKYRTRRGRRRYTAPPLYRSPGGGADEQIEAAGCSDQSRDQASYGANPGAARRGMANEDKAGQRQRRKRRRTRDRQSSARPASQQDGVAAVADDARALLGQNAQNYLALARLGKKNESAFVFCSYSGSQCSVFGTPPKACACICRKAWQGEAPNEPHTCPSNNTQHTTSDTLAPLATETPHSRP